MIKARVRKSGVTMAEARPLLKWAGGKTQLLGELTPRVPAKYQTYIEPFFGGGALFFALRPEKAVIADSNRELTNLYQAVANDVDGLMAALSDYQNDEDLFYHVRAQDWQAMPSVKAAARTIFLNRTCYNGLYRVNKSGQFNVPFGRYKNPLILDEPSLLAAAQLLRNTTIVHGDYKTVLRQHAQSGDFVFLDPPYLPISKIADFKRYTKEQFYEEDHHELAAEVARLHDLGCHVVLTNSNHPLNNELYSQFKRVVVPTRRFISCDGAKRTGEDVIVEVPFKKRLNLRLITTPNVQSSRYPTTRYMGAKGKLLDRIWGVASQFKFETAVDLFSGSGVVGYMLKSQGKAVISNDHMAMATVYAKAMIENNSKQLDLDTAQSLMVRDRKPDRFVEKTFQGLYFTDAENRLMDVLRANIAGLRTAPERAIAKAALIRTCLKKRPRGIFTYVGHRYDDGRKDLRTSFADHFLDAVKAVNAAVFDNGQTNAARNGDAMTVKVPENALIYMDPPYYSPFSDNEYVRRYHFVEGLARDWNGVEIQEHTQTKKFKSYPTPFTSRRGATDAFDKLFRRFRDNVLLVSYSSNSQPTMEELIELMSRYKSHVDVVPVDHKYSFGNQGHKIGDNKNTVQEYLFVGY